MAEFREPYLVVGSKGMLGTDLVKLLRDSHVDTMAVDVEDVDIRQPESVKKAVALYKPGVIINVAAITDVDGCETRREEAFSVNADGPANLARAAVELGSALVHVSTDYVFDGRKGSPYLETDQINPVGVYGKSKAQGELQVRELLPHDHCIVRTQWLYGLHGKNFVESILDAAKTRPVLKVVDDQTGSPTFTSDLAGALVKLCKERITGTVHITNSGHVTWHGFAATIIEMEGPVDVRVEPITTEDLGRPAPRPAYSVLDNSEFIKLVGTPLRSWKEALGDYLRRRTERGITSA
jgi:dTDP-4-dehydrorhamnose reductase